MAINQVYLFVLFILNGMIIGLLFDIFRILRKSFKTKDFIIYFEDILFWILAGISIIFFMYKFSDGNLRLFMLLGLIIGEIIYLISFSRIIINVSMIIINNILKQIINFITLPIKLMINTIFKAVYFLKSKTKLFIIKDKIKQKN